MEMQVKGVKYYRNRHGKWYAYHRKTGRRIRAEPGTAAFLAELEEIERGAGSEPPPLAGTLGALIADYRESPEFTQLAPCTRSDYQAIFDYLKPLAAHPLSGINAAYAIRVRDHAFKRKKRHFANYVVVVMRLLFKWGKVRGRLRDNPAADVPKLLRPKGMPKANRRWTAEELRIVLDAMPPELRLATALGVTTGMREGDVLRFPWSGYRDGLIQCRAAKTGEAIWMPAHPMLRELLEGTPKKSPIIVIGARGKPYTEDGFRRRFFDVIRRLESEGRVAPRLTFHGLRTTTATMLAEAGCDTQTIMAITGHKTEAMVRAYTEEADKKGRAVVAIAKLDFAKT